MYAVVQKNFETFREKALSNRYTAAAMQQFEKYTDVVKQASADASAKLTARRDELVARAQGRCEPTVTMLRERRDALAGRLSEKLAPVKETVERVKTQVAEKQALVSSTAASIKERTVELKARVEARKAQAADALEAAVNFVFSTVAFVLAYAMAVLKKVRAVLEARVPKLVDAGLNAVIKVASATEGAVERVRALDAQFGGFVFGVLGRLQTESIAALEALEAGQPVSEAAAEEKPKAE